MKISGRKLGYQDVLWLLGSLSSLYRQSGALNN